MHKPAPSVSRLIIIINHVLTPTIVEMNSCEQPTPAPRDTRRA
jgi:hypothetical protein